jgi:hypothetical protein
MSLRPSKANLTYRNLQWLYGGQTILKELLKAKSRSKRRNLGTYTFKHMLLPIKTFNNYFTFLAKQVVGQMLAFAGLMKFCV